MMIKKDFFTEVTEDYGHKPFDEKFAIIQEELLYDYCISTIFHEAKGAFLNSDRCLIYLEDKEREHMLSINSCDHRLVMGTHNRLAKVFRFYVLKGKFEKRLFHDKREQIIRFFDYLYTNILFLDYIEEEYWYLLKYWIEFVQTEIRNNYELVRELAKATLVYAEGDNNRELRWEASDRAKKIIEEKYSFVSFY